MYEHYDKHGADLRHSLQAFHYLKAKNLPEAHVVYICKDDLRLLEFGVFNPSKLEDVYYNDIKSITKYVTENKQPDVEKPILFEHNKFKKGSRFRYGMGQLRFQTPLDVDGLPGHIRFSLVRQNIQYRPRALVLCSGGFRKSSGTGRQFEPRAGRITDYSVFRGCV